MAINTQAYIGLGKRQAQNKAELDNLIFRLISSNGEPILTYPEDIREDRICIEIENDKVSKATVM